MTSTPTTHDIVINELAWMEQAELAQLGFTPGGPERDYGMRWGDNQSVRVSYAPHADPQRAGGYLYAHDRRSDRYALLAADTSPQQIERAWPHLPDLDRPEGYRDLVRLLEQVEPMSVDEARTLLLHCLDRELAAQWAAFTGEPHSLSLAAQNAPASYGRAARLAAEDLLLDAVAAVNPDDFLVVEYRIPSARAHTGHLASLNAHTVGDDVADLRRVVAHNGFGVDVVNFTHQGVTVPVGLESPSRPLPAASASVSPSIEL